MALPARLARFDGRVLVPEEALGAVQGDLFEVRPTAIRTPESDWGYFLDGVEGSWIGSDMEEPNDPAPGAPDL